MRKRATKTKFILLAVLLILGLAKNFSLQVTKANPSSTDLNVLILSKFKEWDAFITSITDINGTTTDPYFYSFFPTWQHIVQSTLHHYLYALMNVHKESSDSYYLRKLQIYVDAYINQSGTNGFCTADSYKGEIFYAPNMYYGGANDDPTPKSAMAVGIASVYLYDVLGDSKYKDLADRIANESYDFALVNNATDMAWRYDYYFNGTEEDCKIGVNRQGSIAYFYAIYGEHINSTYKTYVPKIINWIWRAQLENGGLSYDIGGSTVTNPYTGFSIWFALSAYEYASAQFSETLKTKIADSISYMETIQGSRAYLLNYVVASALALSVKTGFKANPSATYLDKTKTYIYTSLQTMYIAKQGFVSISRKTTGYSWQMWFVGCFFSLYPLPDNLKTFTTPKITLDNYQTGRWYWEGYTFDWGAKRPLYVGDSYTNVGTNFFPFYAFVSYGSAGITSRELSFNENGYAEGTVIANSNASVIYYSSMGMYGNITGTSDIKFQVLSDFPLMRLRLANGTIINLGTSENLTNAEFGTDFLIWRNNTDKINRRSIFVYSLDASTYNLTRTASYIYIEAHLTNYSVCFTYQPSWSANEESEDVFSKLQTRAHNRYDTPRPTSFDSELISYLDRMVVNYPDALPHFNQYKKATTGNVRLIAHNKPEDVNLTAWSYNPKLLTFSISAPSGTTSITKVYCGDKGKPKNVEINNQVYYEADKWTWDSTNSIVTITWIHSSDANILLDWRVVGGEEWEPPVILPFDLGFAVLFGDVGVPLNQIPNFVMLGKTGYAFTVELENPNDVGVTVTLSYRVVRVSNTNVTVFSFNETFTLEAYGNTTRDYTVNLSVANTVNPITYMVVVNATCAEGVLKSEVVTTTVPGTYFVLRVLALVSILLALTMLVVLAYKLYRRSQLEEWVVELVELE